MRWTVFPLLLVAVGCPGSHGSDDPPPDGGTPSDAGAARDAATAPDAGAAEDGGGPPDDGGAPPDDAAVARDAGETPVDAGVAGPARIRCGNAEFGTTECDAETQGCLASCLYATGDFMPACVAKDPEGRWPAAECPTGMEQFPRLWLTCDGAEDCAGGELCHMLYGSLGQYAYCFECGAGCDRRFLHVLCRSDADCSPEAPRCLPQRDLPGYSTCEAM